jgi:biotin carboxyl carrier protein
MHTHLLRIAGRDYKAEVKELTPERAVVIVDGKEYAVDLVRIGRKKLTPEAVRAAVGGAAPASGAAAPAPSHAPAAPAAPAAAPVGPAASRPAPSARGEGGITAPMPGLIIAVKVKEGDTVQAGHVLLVMEAMKMENAITASYNGTVTKICVREGDSISEGDLLVEVARPKMTAL